MFIVFELTKFVNVVVYYHIQETHRDTHFFCITKGENLHSIINQLYINLNFD
jgi:hypothetical protein